MAFPPAKRSRCVRVQRGHCDFYDWVSEENCYNRNVAPADLFDSEELESLMIRELAKVPYGPATQDQWSLDHPDMWPVQSLNRFKEQDSAMFGRLVGNIPSGIDLSSSFSGLCTETQSARMIHDGMRLLAVIVAQASAPSAPVMRIPM